MKGQRRRHFLQRALGLVPVILVAPAAVRQALADTSCAQPESESLRGSLHYVAMAADPQKDCKVCGFFTPKSSGGCGECQILGGPVDATGHCESWSAKS